MTALPACVEQSVSDVETIPHMRIINIFKWLISQNASNAQKKVYSPNPLLIVISSWSFFSYTTFLLRDQSPGDINGQPNMSQFSRKASFVGASFLGLVLTVRAVADNCAQPFSIPITNVDLVDGTYMRGLAVTVGTPGQTLSMMASV